MQLHIKVEETIEVAQVGEMQRKSKNEQDVDPRRDDDTSQML